MIKKCIWTECNSIHKLSTKSNDINHYLTKYCRNFETIEWWEDYHLSWCIESACWWICDCARLSWFFFLCMVLWSSVSTQIRWRCWPRGTVPCPWDYPTLTQLPLRWPTDLKLKSWLLLDKVCSTGQSTKSRITIYGHKALKYTDMNGAAKILEWSSCLFLSNTEVSLHQSSVNLQYLQHYDVKVC